MQSSELHSILFENFQDLDRTFTLHHHETYSVGVTHRGVLHSEFSHNTLPVYQGSTRVLNPFEAHSATSHAWALTNFYPTTALMRTIYTDIFHEEKTPIFEHHVIEDPKLYALLSDFFAQVYRGADKMAVESAMVDALSYLILHYAHTKTPQNSLPDPRVFSRVLDRIHAEADRPLTLGNLAQEASLSKYHFLRTFKQYTGLTPHQYILSTRIRKATKMIISGESIAQASFASGFSDQSHFTRHFKRIYGYTPHALMQKRNIVLYPS